MANNDVIVVGGGLVGISIAYGLAQAGLNTMVLDEGDQAFRAARGNFGLIWVQGKGVDCPAYARWTRRSADCWEAFNQQLETATDIRTAYARPGGVDFCLNEKEYAERSCVIERLTMDSDGAFQGEMLRRKALLELMPQLGDSVVGASFSPMDGHVNPLRLLRALYKAFKAKKGTVRHESVRALSRRNAHFEVKTTGGDYYAPKVVLAAGLGNEKLAKNLGMCVPVRPQRGQILVTEKLEPFLNYPTGVVRQTEEGSVMLGDSQEEVGFDDGTSLAVMADIAHQARRIFPHLEHARLIRAWGALRILSPDGLPIYEQSQQYPGAFAVSSHSGVTLAAVHARDFARYVVVGQISAQLDAFSGRRFDVH